MILMPMLIYGKTKRYSQRQKVYDIGGGKSNFGGEIRR